MTSSEPLPAEPCPLSPEDEKLARSSLDECLTVRGERCGLCKAILAIDHARAERDEARRAITRDRTGLGVGLDHVRRLVEGWRWLAEGGWGSYDDTERTEETLRKEFASCLDGVDAAAREALRASGLLADAAVRGEPLPAPYAPAPARAVALAESLVEVVPNRDPFLPWGLQIAGGYRVGASSTEDMAKASRATVVERLARELKRGGA